MLAKVKEDGNAMQMGEFYTEEEKREMFEPEEDEQTRKQKG